MCGQFRLCPVRDSQRIIKEGMRTILVVDDEAKIVKLVRDYLERAGFRVLTAANGKNRPGSGPF